MPDERSMAVVGRWTAATLSTVLVWWAIGAGPSHAQSPSPRTQPEAGRRLALVVGIDGYPKSPLQNARNDARAMATALRDIGFTVTHLEDASRNQLVNGVASFSEQIRSDDVTFFFYAGHGVQIDGENYLVPADFDAVSTTAARLSLLPVGELQAAFGRAKVSVLVLDACRNNPFSNTRAAGRGLAPVEARGNLIAFATGAGQTASDNPAAGNGLFTGALLSTLREPNLPLREVFYRVRQRVYDATKGQQFPAVYDGLIGDVVLRADGSAPPTPAPAVATAPPVGTAPPAESRFDLMHWGRSGLSPELHPGVLSVSRGQIRWSETRANPKDDFTATCADIGEISARLDIKDRKIMMPGGIYNPNANLRYRGRNYDYVVLRKTPPEPPSDVVIQAIQAACPAVKVKK